jgi:hypothetical protein
MTPSRHFDAPNCQKAHIAASNQPHHSTSEGIGVWEEAQDDLQRQVASLQLVKCLKLWRHTRNHTNKMAACFRVPGGSSPTLPYRIMEGLPVIRD